MGQTIKEDERYDLSRIKHTQFLIGAVQKAKDSTDDPNKKKIYQDKLDGLDKRLTSMVQGFRQKYRGGQPNMPTTENECKGKTVAETLRFMLFARNIISNNILESNMLNESEKYSLSNYFLYEASDYEIAYYLVEEKLPKQKNNIVGEVVYTHLLNKIIKENEDILSKYNVPVMEFEALSLYRLSSNKTVFNFLVEHNMIESSIVPYLTELSIEELREKAKKAKEKAGQIASDTKTGMKYAKNVAGQKAGQLAAQGKEIAGQAKEKAGQLAAQGKEAASGMISKMKDSPTVQNLLSKVSANRSLVLGGLLLATMVAYAAYKRYRDNYNKFVAPCANLPGDAKAACIKKAKINSFKSQIADLQKGASACSRTKDPAGCKASIMKKIAKLQAKMASV